MRPLIYFTLPLAMLLGCGGPTDNHNTTDGSSDTSTLDTTETDASETTESESETETSGTADSTDPRSVLTDLPERDHARELGLTIIQSYFEGDPTDFIAMIADIVPQVGREGEAMDGEYFREMVAHVTPYPSGEDFTMYTMEQYHDVFDPLVVTYDEAVEHFAFPTVDNAGWIPEPQDFIYFGGTLQLDKREEDKFIRDGLNSFVFGKRDGVWKFVGFVS